MKLRWTRYHARGQAPSRAYEGDAGFDLYAIEDIWIEPLGYADIRCGIAIEWPTGIWGFMTGRSSAFREHGLLVHPAIIDNGFRGELFALARNMNDEPVQVKEGQRVAQIIPIPLYANAMEPVEVDELARSDRGTNGFGSSGR